MAATPTEVDHKVTTRAVSLTEEMKKVLGKKWQEPEVEYEFSNGRKFVISPQDVYSDR